MTICEICHCEIIYSKARTRIPDKCSRWKCKNHILCDGWHSSCTHCEFATCNCAFSSCPDTALMSFCHLCLSEDEKYHAIFPCGHSMACVDCYKEKCPIDLPDALDYGATVSEDDDIDLFSDDGKWARRDHTSWERFMKDDEDTQMKMENWHYLRCFDVCHVCRV